MAEGVKFLRILQGKSSIVRIVMELENGRFTIFFGIRFLTRKWLLHVPFHIVV